MPVNPSPWWQSSEHEDQISREFKLSQGPYIKIKASLGYMTFCMEGRRKDTIKRYKNENLLH